MSRLTSSYRRIGEYEVVEADVDAIGHMSVRRYAEIAERVAATAVGGVPLGSEADESPSIYTTPSKRGRIAPFLRGLCRSQPSQTSATAVPWITDMVTRQHHEQLLGAHLAVHAVVVAEDSHKRTFHIELRNDADNELASTHRFTVGLLDAAQRRPIPLANHSDRDATMAVEPEYARPRRLGTAPFATRTPADFDNCTIEVWSDRVLSSDECDAEGWFCGGPTQLAWGLPGAPRPETQWQFTTTDERDFALADVEHRRWIAGPQPRVGTHLRTLSANVAIERNRRVRREWTFDVDTGTLHAVGEFVDLLVDLAARRAADVPDEIRALLATHLHPDLGDDTAPDHSHDPTD